MIHCDPDVKKQIQAFLGQITAFSRSYPNNELGFEVERVDGQINVNPIRRSDNFREFTPRLNGNTLALIHHHPSGNATPSGNDMNLARGNNPAGRKLVVYSYAIDEGAVRAKLFNGNNPTDKNGKPRIVTPADCPKKK
jgi:hypothetical protein